MLVDQELELLPPVAVYSQLLRRQSTLDKRWCYLGVVVSLWIILCFLAGAWVGYDFYVRDLRHRQLCVILDRAIMPSATPTVSDTIQRLC